MIRRPPISTLFPTTPLFRSRASDDDSTTCAYRSVPKLGPPRHRLLSRPSARRHSQLAAREFFSFLPDRKSTRLNSSHSQISYAVFCLKKKTTTATSLQSLSS